MRETQTERFREEQGFEIQYYSSEAYFHLQLLLNNIISKASNNF